MQFEVSINSLINRDVSFIAGSADPRVRPLIIA
jgi:hypothetical protein